MFLHNKYWWQPESGECNMLKQERKESNFVELEVPFDPTGETGRQLKQLNRELNNNIVDNGVGACYLFQLYPPMLDDTFFVLKGKLVSEKSSNAIMRIYQKDA